jgi:hypothetical protein
VCAQSREVLGHQGRAQTDELRGGGCHALGGREGYGDDTFFTTLTIRKGLQGRKRTYTITLTLPLRGTA